MINRDITFDETFILNPRPYEDHDNKVEVHGVNKKVELEIDVPKQELKEILEDVVSIELEYILARNRSKKSYHYNGVAIFLAFVL